LQFLVHGALSQSMQHGTERCRNVIVSHLVKGQDALQQRRNGIRIEGLAGHVLQQRGLRQWPVFMHDALECCDEHRVGLRLVVQQIVIRGREPVPQARIPGQQPAAAIQQGGGLRRCTATAHA